MLLLPYDYRFERIWKNPDRDIQKLKRYKAVLSPDFSMYTEMNPTVQLYNTFRNRWCGAYMASKGIKVVPTVNWGNENTFDFCFAGIPKGSAVAVSTYMVSEHGNRADQKEFFLKGYNEMLKRIEPEYIICYNTPFPEMQGNIIFVDYELSSWRYQKNSDLSAKIVKTYCEDLLFNEKCDKIVKSGYYFTEQELKGTGSAYGGEWKPKKPADQRLLGKPGEIKTNYVGSERFDTKIGDDGRAVLERHYTDHGNNKKHTNPHDHIIDWEQPTKGIPNFIKPFINYYGDVPEFKSHKGEIIMDNQELHTNKFYYDGLSDFESIAEFKDCMIRGGEVQFIWKDKAYGAFGGLQKTPDSPIQMYIGQSHYEKDGKYYNTLSHEEYDFSDEVWADTPDELLEYMMGEDRLRDVITKVHVFDRPI